MLIIDSSIDEGGGQITSHIIDALLRTCKPKIINIRAEDLNPAYVST
jgi:RNA 3'-terminal phosphate cyclase